LKQKKRKQKKLAERAADLNKQKEGKRELNLALVYSQNSSITYK